MSDKMAFTGVLTAVKHLKVSGDLQFIITVPSQMANEALRRAGGFPTPDKSRWVAVAALEEPTDDDVQIDIEEVLRKESEG